MSNPSSAAVQQASGTTTGQQQSSRKRHLEEPQLKSEPVTLPSPPLSRRACAVCGDHASELVASGTGAAAAVCDSCKAFYRRNCGRQHQCSLGGECEVTVATRKNCRACRYRRCTAAGLRQGSPPPPPLPPPPQQQQQQQQQPEKRSRSSSFDSSAPGSSCADTEIPTKPMANWRDALLKVTNYYGEDRTPLEADFIANMGRMLDECTNSDMSVPFTINHDLTRGLSEQLNNWSEMITQLEIFIQPAIRFCKLFLASEFFKDMPNWRPEHSVLLVKLRIHSILVPIFSHKFDSGSRQLSVSIAGKSYAVDPNRSIRELDRSFLPGLSAVTSNDRYFEYVRKVTDGDLTLIGLFVLLKLFDMSLAEKEELADDMEQLSFNMFMRLAKCTRHAFIARFDDRWLPKMKELCILFEWSKTFDLSLSALFTSISSQSPTPLFAEIYT